MKDFTYWPSTFTFILSSLIISGCSNQWQTDSADTPWVAPGKQAVEYSRKDNDIWSPRIEVAWEDSSGSKRLLVNEFKSSDEYLMNTGQLVDWPTIDKWSNDIQCRVAPFLFYIVSIDPTVVVLIPHDFGELDGRSIYEIVGESPIRTCTSDYLVNYIRYGTKIPYSSKTHWFSPDLKTGVRDLDINESGVGTINLGSGKLIFVRNGKQWHVTRDADDQ